MRCDKCNYVIKGESWRVDKRVAEFRTVKVRLCGKCFGKLLVSKRRQDNGVLRRVHSSGKYVYVEDEVVV